MNVPDDGVPAGTTDPKITIPLTMIDLLTPELTVDRPPKGGDAARYVRSYLIMRLFIGALGVALPLVLVLCDGVLFGLHPFPRDSLSAYYYSSARELFVGALCATGVFLITYKVADRTLDNTLSIVAGAAALIVALFPTGRADHVQPLTPLQDRLGETVVQTIHFGAAALFILSLGVICYFFGIREGARAPRPGKRSPEFWRHYHWLCAGGIAAAVTWIAITQISGEPRTSLLFGEWAAAWAFGASWFMKGLELDFLRR
jgi:hypothetical protein